MGKMVDLSGKTFGKLYVEKVAYKDKNNHIRWICKCECGKEIVVSGVHLKSGHTKSCGCLKGEWMKQQAEDYTNNIYGRWKVIEDFNNLKCLCECSCGTRKIVSKSSLKNGDSKSCGCLSKELLSDRMKQNYKPKEIEDLTGKKYGKLTVVHMMPHEIGDRVKWYCECECGGNKIVKGVDLKRNYITQCGCETIHKKRYRKEYPRLYRIWENMKDRTSNPNNTAYERYGEREIIICKEWKDSFENFCKWSLDNGYNELLTIDRIDNNKGYSPDNCRWTDIYTQANNTRRNVYYEYNGEKKSISEWCRYFGAKRSTVDYRLKHGYTFEEAFEI